MIDSGRSKGKLTNLYSRMPMEGLMRDIEPFRLLPFLGIMVIGLMIPVPAAVSVETPDSLYMAGKRHYESGRYPAASDYNGPGVQWVAKDPFLLLT